MHKPKPSKSEIHNWINAEVGKHFYQWIREKAPIKKPNWRPETLEDAHWNAGMQELLAWIDKYWRAEI